MQKLEYNIIFSKAKDYHTFQNNLMIIIVIVISTIILFNF